VELSEEHNLVLLKEAKRRSRVSARLIAAVEHERKGKRGRENYHLFSGFRTDGLALRASAMVHAPEALPAIDLGLKLANEGEKGAGS
jgi:hypothetical protein